jgi:four helix bundle protein
MTGNESKPRDIKERTFAFALEIVRLCRTLDGKRGTARTLGRQLLGSGTSIGANVEEAQAGQSQADFISKYNIALKEARETIYWLRLLDASEESPDGACKTLTQEAEEIARIIGSIIVNTRKNSKNK